MEVDQPVPVESQQPTGQRQTRSSSEQAPSTSSGLEFARSSSGIPQPSIIPSEDTIMEDDSLAEICVVCKKIVFPASSKGSHHADHIFNGGAMWLQCCKNIVHGRCFSKWSFCS